MCKCSSPFDDPMDNCYMQKKIVGKGVWQRCVYAYSLLRAFLALRFELTIVDLFKISSSKIHRVNACINGMWQLSFGCGSSSHLFPLEAFCANVKNTTHDDTSGRKTGWERKKDIYQIRARLNLACHKNDNGNLSNQNINLLLRFLLAWQNMWVFMNPLFISLWSSILK